MGIVARVRKVTGVAVRGIGWLFFALGGAGLWLANGANHLAGWIEGSGA